MLTVLSLVIIVSFFLPSSAHIERSTEIVAPAKVVYAQLSDFDKWPTWDPWSTIDSAMKVSYPEGISAGVGAVRAWESEHPNVGSGTMKLLDAMENDSLSIELDLGFGAVHTAFKLKEDDGKTRVVWSYDGDTGTPPVIGRYFGLFLDGMVGPDYEKGLASLKALCEAMPVEPELPPVEVSTIDMETPIWVLALNAVCPREEVANALASNYNVLQTYVSTNSIEVTGMPMARYNSYGLDGDMVNLDAALPIADSVAVDVEHVFVMRLGPGKVAKTTHLGPYSALGETVTSFQAQLEAMGAKIGSSHWEHYVTDPGEEPDPSKWATDLYYPLND